MELHRKFENRHTKFSCIANKARENKGEQFISLAHHLTDSYLFDSFRKLRRSASSGIDKESVSDYQINIEERLEDLHSRLRAQQYRAPNIRRAWIDKGDGKQRPLGISTTEDKIVQRGVSDLLQLIYEQDFYDFSYGFRPKRSAHQALQEVRKHCMSGKINWILDADIQGCFDNFNHKIMIELIQQRVKDGSLLRLMRQWLKAGIVDGNSFQSNTLGTPQGNIISPLLSNIYLHYVLDQWIIETVKPLLKGEMFIVRYADDFVIGFEHHEDAKRVYQTLPKRMQKYGLTIHPEKSQLICFHPDNRDRKRTFDFLGFTHYWGRSKRGYKVVKRCTACKKMRKARQNLRESCKNNRHLRVGEQLKLLNQKLRGMYNYYGIRGNFHSIYSLYRYTILNWLKWLNRRSQRKSYTWQGYQELLKRFQLLSPRIVHANV